MSTSINTQNITLKMELAKEKSINKSLKSELEATKRQYEEEIESMMSTIEMQSKIIKELSEKCDTIETLNEVLDQSAEIVELEADLNLDCSWEILDEAENVKSENVKMVVQLATEVDLLTERLENANIDLEDAKKSAKVLESELKQEKATSQAEKEEMISIQSDLARDILDLKVAHEHEIGQANVQIKRQVQKTRKLKVKFDSLKRGADEFIGTSRVFCEYDIIC